MIKKVLYKLYYYFGMHNVFLTEFVFKPNMYMVENRFEIKTI